MDESVISVILAVHNGEKYIVDSIQSVLEQEYSEIELLVVDDGSRDSTSEILRSVASQDQRVRVFTNEKNCGLAASLNLGIRESKGSYIARMDADDLAHRARLYEQFKAFEEDENLILVGTNASYIDSSGNEQGLSQMPKTDWAIRSLFAVVNPFIHSSVMIRSQLIKKNNLSYDENYKAAQDYEYWSRLLQYGKCRNLEGPYMKLRLHSDSVSQNYKNIRIENGLQIQRAYIETFFNKKPDLVCALREHQTKICSGTSDVQERPLSTIPGCYYGLELIKYIKRSYPDESLEEPLEFVLMRCIRTLTKQSLTMESLHLCFKLLRCRKIYFLKAIKNYWVRS